MASHNADSGGRYEWTRDGWGNLVPTPNADSGRVIGRPTPVLIQWWRCGKAHAGKGWTTCKTPEACSRDGCVKVPPNRQVRVMIPDNPGYPRVKIEE